jgi:hypothetical protein
LKKKKPSSVPDASEEKREHKLPQDICHPYSL